MTVFIKIYTLGEGEFAKIKVTRQIYTNEKTAIKI
jgi:hypothetical protein